MNKRQLASFKKVLLQRKGLLLKQVLNQDDDIYDLRGDQPADPLDMAGNTSSLELMTTLSNHERIELSEIDRALDKIEEKVYGNCEGCDKNIALARLKAIPTARLCMDCKEKQERNPQMASFNRPRRRIILNDDLPAMTDEDS